ncbi:MAG: hypothetical protein ACPKNR_09910 [Pleomorphochaeta sp.]|jgi:hypothetical protein
MKKHIEKERVLLIVNEVFKELFITALSPCAIFLIDTDLKN